MAYRGIFMQFIDTNIKPKEFDMYYLLQDLAENGTTAFILRPYRFEWKTGEIMTRRSASVARQKRAGAASTRYRRTTGARRRVIIFTGVICDLRA